jgi:hypothetical protein
MIGDADLDAVDRNALERCMEIAQRERTDQVTDHRDIFLLRFCYQPTAVDHVPRACFSDQTR